MRMQQSREVLPVHLQADENTIFVGELVRYSDQIISFHFDDSYIRMSDRPVLSSSLVRRGDPAGTEDLLRTSSLLRGGRGLPPWFENLLPEGALRDFLEDGLSRERRSDFDLIKRLGGDLSGAVIVGEPVASTPAIPPLNDLRFSLAGVQIKLSMLRVRDGFDMTENGIGGDTVVKLPSPKLPFLPEVEFSSMRLAAAAGVDVAYCELVPLQNLAGVPESLQEGGGFALAVDRFDRPPCGHRIHMEDFNQILGVPADRKYAAANDETVLKIAGIFGGGEVSFLQACRRAAVNILLGNTDAHLKNWSVWYPEPSQGRLSPAYDIVAGAVYDHSDDMALRFRRTRNSSIMDTARFERAAAFAGFASADVRAELGSVVEKAADTWGSLLRDLPMPEDYADFLLERAQRLALTQDFSERFITFSKAYS